MHFRQDHNTILSPGSLPAGRSISGPAKGSIHLWVISLQPGEGIRERCYSMLTDAEKQRAGSFRLEQAKDNFVISQGGLRILLSAYLDREPAATGIGRHPKGKPFSLDDPGLHFNISNSGRWVIYAFSRDTELGVDIEFLRPLPDLDELVARNFTERERNYISKVPAERLARFFRFWTVKEAYLKAIGEGMRLPPDRLEFSVENGRFRLSSAEGFHEQDQWYFEEASPDEFHTGTLVHRMEKAEVVKMNF